MKTKDTSLTPEDKRRRKILVSRIKEWERILAGNKNPTIQLIAKDNIKSFKELLEKGDNYKSPETKT